MFRDFDDSIFKPRFREVAGIPLHSVSSVPRGYILIDPSRRSLILSLIAEPASWK